MHLVPVGFIEYRPCEDDDVEGDAEAVEDGEGGDEAQEGGLEVQGSSEDHPQGHQVAWGEHDTAVFQVIISYRYPDFSWFRFPLGYFALANA